MALFDASFTEEEFDEHSNDQDFLFALQLQNRFDQGDQPKVQQSKTTDQVEIDFLRSNRFLFLPDLDLFDGRGR